MQRFYLNNITGDNLHFTPEESRHCVKVLRLNAGDRVELTDGSGALCSAVIAVASAKECILKIEERRMEPAPSWQLHIAIAPTKNIARMEWLIEKLTEIGITEFVPFVAGHSERKVLKAERLKKISIEAMKQSGRTYLPIIREMVPFDKILDGAREFKGLKFILHCHKHIARSTFGTEYKRGENALILIGPEGDFTEHEVSRAMAQNFSPILLGKVRFRTETAAMVAACTIHALNNQD